MKKVLVVFVGIFILFASSCTFEKAEPLSVGCSTPVSYSADIDTIIVAQCEGCHFAGAAEGDFSDFNVLKSKVDAGVFKNRVFTLKNMPQGGSLSPEDLGKLRCWVEQGAPNN